MRGRHLFCDGTVQVPSSAGESEIWAGLLGQLELKSSDRVSIIHFFEVDIMVNSTADCHVSFDYIDRMGPTKYQLMDTGNFSRESPARPAASKSDIENSIFYGVATLLYSDYLLTACTWQKSKMTSSSKRKSFTLSSA